MSECVLPGRYLHRKLEIQETQGIEGILKEG